MSILAAHSDSLSIQTCVDLVCMSACLDGTWPALLLNVPTRLFLSLSQSESRNSDYVQGIKNPMNPAWWNRSQYCTILE